MKKSVLMMTMAAATLSAVGTVQAQGASPHSLTSNVGLFSQYIFRGINYSDEDLALQGGIDYAHDSGWYAGIWASSLDEDQNAGNSIEVDFYGGYYHQLNDDWAFDIGLLQFYYPDRKKEGMNGERIDTTEIYLAATWKWFTAKYSRTLNDWGGVNNKSMGEGRGNSKGTSYYELNFDYGLPWWDVNLALHVGYQDVRNYSYYNYTDWSVGLSKDFSIAGTEGWTVGIQYSDTDAKKRYWDDRGDDQFIAYLVRTF